jgi:hypothetical protein
MSGAGRRDGTKETISRLRLLCNERGPWQLWQVAKEAVLTLGAHPIEEKNFPTDYRELQDLLARRLDPCDAIIHLVGFYGGEPKAPPDTPRRSWTQWEYYRATQGERHKPLYRFLARVSGVKSSAA